MSAFGPSPTYKTFPEQLEQLLQICEVQTQFHEKSKEGVLAFKEELGLKHFNVLPDRYPSIKNIDELAHCMHKYQLSLSSLVTLHFSFSNLLPQALKECNSQVLNELIESKEFLRICNIILQIFTLKRLKNHLTPYKISTEKELNEEIRRHLIESALLEVQKCKELFPTKTLQVILEGSQSLRGSVVDRVSKQLIPLAIAPMEQADASKPHLEILKTELENLEKRIDENFLEIEGIQKEFSKEVTFVAGFLESLFSLLHTITELNLYQEQLVSLKKCIASQKMVEPSSMEDKLSLQIQKLTLDPDASNESWDSMGDIDLSKLSSAKLVSATFEGTPDWDAESPPIPRVALVAPHKPITPSYSNHQAESGDRLTSEIAKVGDDKSTEPTINKMS